MTAQAMKPMGAVSSALGAAAGRQASQPGARERTWMSSSQPPNLAVCNLHTYTARLQVPMSWVKREAGERPALPPQR